MKLMETKANESQGAGRLRRLVRPDYKAEAIRWKYLAESRARTLEAWGARELVNVAELREIIASLPICQSGADMREAILKCLPND